MPKNIKLSELRHGLDKSYNLKVNLGNDILIINALEILELGKIVLTEFQNRAKMPLVAVNTANKSLKPNLKKRGRPKGSKNRKNEHLSSL